MGQKGWSNNFRLEQGFGCKAEITIFRPDMALVMDEVGCNLLQEMDHVVGR